MGYYGLANFASDFNTVRDNALDSGFRAKQKMRDDWLGDYQMPDKMLSSDVDALGNSIKFDTLNQGYGDMVQTGLNTAQLGAQQSGVNLHKAQADNTIAGLRSSAIRNGLTTESDIANYVAQNVDPAEAATNPYLSNATWTGQQAAYRKLLGTGTALGGKAGDVLAGQAITGLGYGLTPGRDANGNLVFTDAQGRTTGTFGPSGQIPAGMAIYGEVAPAQQAAENAEKLRADAAKTTATLAQKADYTDQRFTTQQQIADQNAYLRWLGYGNKFDIANLRGQKGKPSAMGAAAIGGAPAPVSPALHAWATGYPSSGQNYPATAGTTTGATPVADSTPNPFAQAPSSAAVSADSTAIAPESTSGNAVAPLPPGLLGPPTGPAAYVPAHLTPDAASRLAALGTDPSVPASTPAPPAAAPTAYTPSPAAPPAQPPDPEKELDAASAALVALKQKAAQMDHDVGGMTVYGPRNAPPGWGKARALLSDLIFQAAQRRDAADKAASTHRYTQQQQQALRDAREREARENDAAQALLRQYLPAQVSK